MRTKFYLLILAMVIVGFFTGFMPSNTVVNRAEAQEEEEKEQNQVFRCTVKDPTGTPLNVRSSPGSKKIVAKLKNGAKVFVENFSGDAKDQSWAEVKLSPKKNAKPLGWVLQDFLECDD